VSARTTPPPSRDPRVLAWLAAVGVSWFGDALWTVALAWTAAHTLSPTMAGVVIAAEMIPQAGLLLVGGVVADRFDPRLVLAGGQVARASGADGAATLLAVGVGFGVAGGLTIPAGTAVVRQFVAPEDLGTVIGWQQVVNRVARLLGAPAGGLLVGLGGPVAAMTLDAATFLAVACVTVLVVRPRFPMPRSTETWWLASLTGGLGYLRRHPTARLFVGGVTALNVFVTPVVALGLALRVDDSGWGPHWLGVADGALAAGAILGSLAAIRWRPLHATGTAFRLLVLQGVALAAVGAPVLPVVVLAMAAVGVCAGLASVWLSAAFLTAIDPEYVGRVSSVTNLGDMTLTPLSVPALGAVAATAGVLPATLLFGAAMSVLCLWFATRPVLASLTRPTPEGASEERTASDVRLASAPS
jgi:DHA3 family macrolide efflux protein-like MFS transporter